MDGGRARKKVQMTDGTKFLLCQRQLGDSLDAIVKEFEKTVVKNLKASKADMKEMECDMSKLPHSIDKLVADVSELKIGCSTLKESIYKMKTSEVEELTRQVEQKQAAYHDLMTQVNDTTASAKLLVSWAAEDHRKIYNAQYYKAERWVNCCLNMNNDNVSLSRAIGRKMYCHIEQSSERTARKAFVSSLFVPLAPFAAQIEAEAAGASARRIFQNLRRGPRRSRWPSRHTMPTGGRALWLRFSLRSETGVGWKQMTCETGGCSCIGQQVAGHLPEDRPHRVRAAHRDGKLHGLRVPAPEDNALAGQEGRGQQAHHRES